MPPRAPRATATIRGYAGALLAATGGLIVTQLSAGPFAGPFFMFQFAAVVGAALFGGLGPGLLTMALSAAGFYAQFFQPSLEPYEAYRLGSFLVVSTFFAWLAARMRRAKAAAEEARARAEAAEAEARVMGEHQERLVAIVSHDLRNPLNAITVTTEQLQRGDVSERQAKGLSRVLASAHRMQSLIRDLLDYARLRQGGALPVHPRPVRVGEICRKAIDEVGTAHPGRTVILDVTGNDRATLDPARVEQVVCNLVTNAFKHGAPDAPVHVRISGGGPAVEVEVANAGAPIPARLLPGLFDPFRAGDAAGSLGLGLFIVREIATAHGGTVAVRSGDGATTFTVVFPAGEAAAAPTADVA
jgi:signal transduction histidine kinase